MATYKSNPYSVERSAEDVFERFSDLSRLQVALDGLSEEQRRQVGDVEFTVDSIRIVTPQVGEVSFEIIERVRPEKVVFGTKSSPVPLTMEVRIASCGEATSEVHTVINVDIPAMLRPIIGPQLQKATEKFGELMGRLSR